MIRIKDNTKNQRRFLWILAIIILIVFGNSIDNEYSVDDEFVVHNNTRVEKGISGIPEIFTSRYSESKDQSFGYRPIVLMSYAIEKQLFKNYTPYQTLEEKAKTNKLTQANLSHLFNLLLYILNCVILFFFLRLLFPHIHFVFAAIVALLYALHPVHTEVVDSLKNRDELLAFAGIFGGISLLIKSLDERLNWKLFSSALLLFIFAMLCKKTSVVFLGILPLVFYYKKTALKTAILSMAATIGSLAIIFVARLFLDLPKSVRIHQLYENDLFFNDGLVNRLLLSVSSFWEYLRLLVFPNELSFYYGYAEVTKSSPSELRFWIVLVVVASLLFIGIRGLMQRSILGFGLALFGGIILAYLNILAPVVGVVAERFTYIFSFGFIIAFVWTLFYLFKSDESLLNETVRIPNGLSALIIAVSLVYALKTYDRNGDWENKMTLFSEDCNHLQKSAKANALYAQTLFRSAIEEGETNGRTPVFTEKAKKTIKHFKLAVEIDSTYFSCYSNLGGAYLSLFDDFEKGVYYSKEALKIDSSSVEVLGYLAFAHQKHKDLKRSNLYFYEILKYEPANINALNNYVVNMSKMPNKREQIMRLVALAGSTPKHGQLYRLLHTILSSNNLFKELTPSLLEKAVSYEKTNR